jgi:flagellar assembly factor FliW
MGGMRLQTTLFGEIDVREGAIIRFPEGLIGFEETKEYVLVEAEELKPLAWLVALSDPDLVFPIADPAYFTDRLELRIGRDDRRLLEVRTIDDLDVYLVVTLADETRPMSANLRAPLVFNAKTRIGKQIVLLDERYSHRQPLQLATARAAVG